MIRTLNQYQVEAERTRARDENAYPKWFQLLPEPQKTKALEEWDTLIHALGLAGEAGEVADYLKKVYGHGHQLDRDKVRKELGDTLWYLAVLARDLGFDFEEIASANIAKLRARYPEGFRVAASVNRGGER